MADNDILNFVVIDDRIALAGQPTAAQLRALAYEGYTAVINLAPEDAPGAVEGEAMILADAGLAYHHIPVPMTTPDTTHFARFEQAMTAVGDRRTLIHCAANYRVTAFFSF